MSPKVSFTGVLLSLFLLSLVFAADISAQSRKNAHTKAAVAKKAEKQSRDAKKSRERAAAAKKNDRKSAKEKEKDRRADAKGKKDGKSVAERRKAEAERRRKEEERRQAILAEKRRREQAAREARARKLAFERGLRTETVANIAKDVTDGEDLTVRAAAVNALGSHAGSVVVMEAQTGKVLTIVNQDWAVRSGIKPCSTIKLVTGVAGLNEGVINKEDGSVRNTATRRQLDDAIAFSDNHYFQRVGSNLGNAKMIEYAKDLGLGEPTGLNTPGEYAGKLPFGNNNVKIYSHGEDFEVTTVQLAVLVSEITNGGHRVLPRVPRNDLEKTKFQPFYRADLKEPQQNVRRMIPGMIGAAEYGTAHRGVDASLGIAGKTGSCISKGSWVGLFTSVAPIENPKYAVVVITRGEHERGKYAAAVAGQVYRSLGSQIVRTNRNLAQTEFKIRPRTVVDQKTAARLADAGDDDEADTADTADTGGDVPEANTNKTALPQPIIKQPVVEKPAPKKLVTKTGDSKPLFPPVVITYDRDGKEKKIPGKKPE
jgi:membrane peptidoglycan carboxypeptidase